ncbi:ABC transporter ATP-binding protein [Nocardioides sp. P86]|uniref:ATP-binding cassette domain-containing protein n=1 Tax=Nocardioides sp. P86 TaxID=2939569 RepID=UPI00203EAB4D|nr:ABC transporter ATP-binding protein [Nocardioides sp. P86]MCM3516230.1 ATP-binding cassette domain-containing protein [Nocardioides sp. P86]
MSGLELRGVTHHHPGHHPGHHRGASAPALDDVTLRLAPGERVGLVGRSGAGKTTLLQVALALLAPGRGEVSLDGRAVRPGSVRSLRWYRRAVQYVPQHPAASLDPRHRVERLVAEPARRLGVPGDPVGTARAALARVGLDEDLWRRRPGELSGGQAQRVAVARALACGARLLLADEPVSGLDHDLRDHVLDVVAGLDGIGLLLVCHDLEAVERTCERVVVLDAGRVVEEGPTSRLLAHPAHPATRALVGARDLSSPTTREATREATREESTA